MTRYRVFRFPFAILSILSAMPAKSQTNPAPLYLLRQGDQSYTYAELNDFIAYCRRRGVMVVPEIDIPGHSDYFKRAFGVDMKNVKGMGIIEDVLNEFMDHVDIRYPPIRSTPRSRNSRRACWSIAIGERTWHWTFTGVPVQVAGDRVREVEGLCFSTNSQGE